MFFIKKRYVFRWTGKRNQNLKGKITLRISSAKPYEDIWWFNRPHNDPKAFGSVPLAICIEGKIENEEVYNLKKTEEILFLSLNQFLKSKTST